MTIKEANVIIQNPKDHWYHEVDEAKEYALRFIKTLCNLEDLANYGAEDINYPKVIETVEKIMNSIPGKYCGDCVHFDQGFCLCTLLPSSSWNSPMEDACEAFDDGKEKHDST